MTRPLEQRLEVPCSRCGYHYPRAQMQALPSGNFVCIPRPRCVGNIADRARLDAWKRGHR